MINNNDDIKQGRGNGTKCIGLSIKLKKDCNVGYTIGMEILCETIPDKKNKKAKQFKLKAKKILQS